MRGILSAVSLLALIALASPADAASQLAVAGGGTFANTHSQSAVVTSGLAVGVAAGTQTNTGIAAGVAVNTPAPGGSLTAGIGQNQNLGTSGSFTAGALGGSAAAQNTGMNNGAAVGGGFINRNP